MIKSLKQRLDKVQNKLDNKNGDEAALKELVELGIATNSEIHRYRTGEYKVDLDNFWDDGSGTSCMEIMERYAEERKAVFKKHKQPCIGFCWDSVDPWID